MRVSLLQSISSWIRKALADSIGQPPHPGFLIPRPAGSAVAWCSLIWPFQLFCKICGLKVFLFKIPRMVLILGTKSNRYKQQEVGNGVSLFLMFKTIKNFCRTNCLYLWNRQKSQAYKHKGNSLSLVSWSHQFPVIAQDWCIHYVTIKSRVSSLDP